MSRVHFVIVLFCYCMAGCVNMPNTFPRIEEADRRVVYVVGEVVRGKYLNQFPRCESLEVICMDPPPLGIKIKVLETLIGDPLPDHIYMATTSHYGLIDFTYDSDESVYLIKLWTDGESFIMPRYKRSHVSSDLKGRNLLLLFRDLSIHNLPCEVMSIKKELSLDDMGPELSFHVDQMDDEDRKNIDKFIFEQDRVYSKYGIMTDDLKNLLSEMNQEQLNDDCR